MQASKVYLCPLVSEDKILKYFAPQEVANTILRKNKSLMLVTCLLLCSYKLNNTELAIACVSFTKGGHTCYICPVINNQKCRTHICSLPRPFVRILQMFARSFLGASSCSSLEDARQLAQRALRHCATNGCGQTRSASKRGSRVQTL